MPPSEEDSDSGPSSDTGDDRDPPNTTDDEERGDVAADDEERGDVAEEPETAVSGEDGEEFVFDRGERDTEERDIEGEDGSGEEFEGEDGSGEEFEGEDGSEHGDGPGAVDSGVSRGGNRGDAPWNQDPGRNTGIDENETGLIGWLFDTDNVGAAFLREFFGSVLLVAVIGLLLFAISGVWPPMVAVKSGSMEPHMQRGDLVFVMDEDRLPPEAAIEGSGVATYQSSVETGYRRFGNYGDVIVYRKNGRADATPIIHRTRFWVADGENWYDRANRSFVNGNSCEAIPNCPAPHAGFITKGDSNGQYDQISGISGPVKPGWIKGTAEFRIPWLGHVRLELSELRAGVAGPVPGVELGAG
ncbi:MAG: S26 family signal peptidase [Halobacteriales archaeon]